MDKHIIVYNDPERHRKMLERVKDLDLSPRNKELLLEYATWCRRGGVGLKRINKYLYHLKFIGRWLGKDFDKSEKESVMKVVDIIDSNGYTPHTVYDYKIAMKKFFKWLFKEDKDPFNLKAPSKKKRSKVPSPEELFTEEEIKRFMKRQVGKADYKLFCKNIRCSEVGGHFTKSHGTARFVLEVSEATIIPFSMSCRAGNIYTDIHVRFRLPNGKATIRDYKKGVIEGSPSPPQKRYTDTELLLIINKNFKEKGSVTPKDVKQYTGLHLSSVLRRLEKLKRLKKLKRMEKYPAIYGPIKRE